MTAAVGKEGSNAASLPTTCLSACIAVCITSALDAHAGETRDTGMCPGPVLISGHHTHTQDLICDATDQARKLLEPCGLTQTRPISVQIVSEMDNEHESCVAFFDCETDSLTVLSPSSIPASGEVISALSQVPEDEYFRSVIVHEMTHAFVHQTYPNQFSRVAHEYLAYAMQFASLSVDIRTSALKATQIPEAVDLGVLDEMSLDFGPSQFGVRSYNHFWRPDNRCAIIDRIVKNDSILPESFLTKVPN